MRILVNGTVIKCAIGLICGDLRETHGCEVKLVEDACVESSLDWVC